MPHYQLVRGYEVEERDHFVVAVVFVLSCWMFCFALLWTESHLYLNLISDMYSSGLRLPSSAISPKQNNVSVALVRL